LVWHVGLTADARHDLASFYICSAIPIHPTLKIGGTMRGYFVIVALFPAFALSVRAASPDAAKSSDAITALQSALDAATESLPGLAEKNFARVPLTKTDDAKARELIWKAHAAIIRKDRAKELADRVLTDGSLSMPFSFKSFGEKPSAGHSLWISMHGGGNASKRVNDGQWRNQQRLYTLDEGIYLAPRAPTNTWNLWHEAHIDRLFGRLMEDLIVLEDVNPDRVYLMGYSAGGDGVYAMAPRMADRWAAAAMMAGHPNGISLLSLRNTPIALQCGGNDSAYNRNKVTKEYGDKLDELRKEDPAGYEHFVKIHEGKPHWMNREDAVALPWMATFSRKPIPDRVVWKQTEVPHERSYWLAVPPGTGKVDSLVIAERKGQTVEVTKVEHVDKLIVRLDDRMMDLDQPVTMQREGKVLFNGTIPRTIGTIVKTLDGYGDPKLVFSADLAVNLADR
jgi:poly(3-hydroxybutyrate) depolymerase